MHTNFVGDLDCPLWPQPWLRA